MGPFTIEVFSHGAVNLLNEEIGVVFKVNGQRLKPYLGECMRMVDKTVLEDPPPDSDYAKQKDQA